jgi:putative membrane protein
MVAEEPALSSPPPSEKGEADPKATGTVSPRIRAAVWVFGVVGVAIAIALILRSGVPQIAALLRTAGWQLLWLLPLHVIAMTFTGAANRSLLPRPKLSLPYLTGASLVREAVGWLLPTMRVGSEVSGIRLLMRRGVDGAVACAVIVVELTLWMSAQLIFATIGLVLLLGSPEAGVIPRYAAAGLLAVAATIAVFVVFQRRVGLFGFIERILARVAGPEVLSFTGGTARVDEAIRALYNEPRALIECGTWQLLHFAFGAVETWATLLILGRPIGVRPAVVLESLSTVIQTATFFVPGGLGTQEASLVLVGAAVGVSGQAALALALARRGRQLALGIPSIIAWLWAERKSA